MRARDGALLSQTPLPPLGAPTVGGRFRQKSTPALSFEVLSSTFLSRRRILLFPQENDRECGPAGYSTDLISGSTVSYTYIGSLGRSARLGLLLLLRRVGSVRIDPDVGRWRSRRAAATVARSAAWRTAQRNDGRVLGVARVPRLARLRRPRRQLPRLRRLRPTSAEFAKVAASYFRRAVRPLLERVAVVCFHPSCERESAHQERSGCDTHAVCMRSSFETFIMTLFCCSLPGRCGSQDVTDCVRATLSAIAARPDLLDAQRVGVCGGSHGGFLAAHASDSRVSEKKSRVSRFARCSKRFESLERTFVCSSWASTRSSSKWPRCATPSPT